ncbi:hypothetical protein M431DRAFT_533972, partial [Trichoderma harzianum CBS 226.95]
MRSHGQGGNNQNKNDYTDKKKVRNRLSQQAFRRRRAENLKTLQDRLNSSYKPQNETIARLEEENRNLRMQLVEVQAQLSRFAVNTQLLNDSVSRALNPNPSSHDVANKDVQSQLKIISESPSDDSYNLDEPLDFSSVASGIPFHTEAPVSADALKTSRELPTGLFPSLGVENCQCCGASDICQLSSCIFQKSWAESNSTFSDHL